MSEPALRLEDVRRSFDGKPVLRGVSACAQRGRLIGLLGRNGEGKTTLIRIVLDLLSADSGQVQVLGLTPDSSGRIRGLVGWVPERPVFHETFDAAEALEWRARFFPGWKNDRVAAMAELLSLDLATPVKGASKGTLCKLAWVGALAHDPELFLLDEPTSGLDAVVRERLLREVIPDLKARGKTIIVANHHMEELADQLDDVWLLREGLLAAHPANGLRTELAAAATLSKLIGELQP